jgi:bacterioferritin-associated ferredoxin
VLVCHCNRICDRTVRECIRDGARSIDEVGQTCGAGTTCGGCRPVIGALLADGETRQPEARRRVSLIVEAAAFRLAS